MNHKETMDMYFNTLWDLRETANASDLESMSPEYQALNIQLVQTELLIGIYDVLAKERPGTDEVWMAVHTNHETGENYAYPCASEEAAYEHVAMRALQGHEDIPEGWTLEETVDNWNEFTEGRETMQVVGPMPVDHGGP